MIVNKMIKYELLLCGARQLFGHKSGLQDALSFLLKQKQKRSN